MSQPVLTVILVSCPCYGDHVAQLARPRPPTRGTDSSDCCGVSNAQRRHDQRSTRERAGTGVHPVFDSRSAVSRTRWTMSSSKPRAHDIKTRSTALCAERTSREQLLRKAWEDHTVVNSFGAQAEELIEAVRAVNSAANATENCGSLGGDPPIDWENTTSQESHSRWIEFRDSYPADVVRRQVVDRGRRALVVYGQGHLQRRQVASNYDMSTWQAQTVVSLLERDTGTRVFNIWTWLDRDVALPDVSSWPVPSLAVLKDTTLGERDFGTYARGLLGGNRFAVQDGRLVPLPRDQWRQMRMDDQFDALLYLGSPSTMTFVGMPPICAETRHSFGERLRRFTLAGPPPELANFKKACQLPTLTGTSALAPIAPTIAVNLNRPRSLLAPTASVSLHRPRSSCTTLHRPRQPPRTFAPIISAVRVAIDARKLHDFGIGTYIRNLLRQLARIDRDTDYVLLCRAGGPRRRRAARAELPHRPRAVAELLAPRAVSRAVGAAPRAARRVPRAALRAAAGGHLPLGGDDSRLHPPDVSAVPAEQGGVRLRAGVDVGGGEAVGLHPDGVGSVEARHPALLQRRRRKRSSSSTTRSTSTSG